MNPASAPARAAGDVAALDLRSRPRDRLIIAAAAVVALALVLFGRSSAPVFLALLGMVALVTAVAALRWPLGTLVVASLATLADPVLLPAILPRGFDPSPIGLSEPMLLAAGLVIAVSATRRRAAAAAFRDPVPVLAALFVAAATASAVINRVPPAVAVLGIVVTVDAIAAFVAARMLRVSAGRAGWAVGAVVGVVLIAAVVGIAQHVVDPQIFGLVPFIGQFGEGVRIGSFLGNPNMLASVIGLALPFALFTSARGDRLRWPARVALFVLVLALLLTYSRGGWLAVGIGLIVGALLLEWRALPVLAVVVALAWGTAAVLPRGGGPIDELAGPVDSTVDRFAHLGGGDDLRARFLRDGLPIVDDHPVLGVGPGRYGGAVAAIVPSPVYDEYDTGLFGYRTVHNFWLHLLGETGVVGTTLFLALIAGLLIRFVRAARSASGVAFVVLAGTATMLVVASLNSATEMIFEGNMPSVLIWLMLGIASCLAPGWGRRALAPDHPSP
ncbi:MAG TPA: O-antigen ligase family protein [Candidatus Limnocylindria bacterium]|nr:O-antigen ligase family protein [Candidatus Limnocylindria bacterium]